MVKKLPPSERLVNVAKAVAIIVPLFGVGLFAGNTETFHKWIYDEPLPEVPGHIDGLVSQEIHPEVRQKIETIIAEIEALRTSAGRIESQSHRDDHKLSDRLDKIEELVN